jgi:hypothetical protein
MKRGDWAHKPDLLREHSRLGVIRVSTLQSLGVGSFTAYRRCIPGGPWQWMLPGIVLMENGTPTRDQLVAAALLYGGPNCLVTGLEASRRHGLRDVPDDGRIHLLVPHDRQLRNSWFVTVERTKRMPEAVVRDGVPLAPVVRAVLDGARRIRAFQPVEAMLAEAVQRKRCSVAILSDELEKGCQRGTAVPRRVLASLRTGAQSVAEIRAAEVWRMTKLPEPRRNVPIYDRDGMFIGVPDVYCDEVGFVWEIDSFDFHFSKAEHARTMRRNARYAAADYIVLQTLPSRLVTEPHVVAAEVLDSYAAAASRPRHPVREGPVTVS